MSEDDSELQRLQAKRLAEMQKKKEYTKKPQGAALGRAPQGRSAVVGFFNSARGFATKSSKLTRLPPMSKMLKMSKF